MSKTLAVTMAVGLVCVALAVAGILYMQRGAHLEMPGRVLKARTAALDEKSAFAALDFRVTNTSNYPAVVRELRVVAELPDGSRLESATISDPDAKRVFEAIPLLGEKYNASLISRDRLPPRATWDRMIAARFETSEATLRNRRRFIISVEEIDGKVFEIPEN